VDGAATGEAAVDDAATGGAAVVGGVDGTKLAPVSDGGAGICAVAGHTHVSASANPVRRIELTRDMVIGDGPFHFFVWRRYRRAREPYHANDQKRQQKQKGGGDDAVHG
jgi:hypothetical protein